MQGPQRRRERKLSLVFRQPEADTKHCAGVESLLLVPGHQILFTGSRDSSIKRWNVDPANGEPTHDASFDGHTDWVNSIALVNDVLVSGSNDKTVRIWRGTSDGVLLTTLSHHCDYVTSVVAAQDANLIATAGLRGEVFVIDLGTAATTRIYPQPEAASRGASQKPNGDPSVGASPRALRGATGGYSSSGMHVGSPAPPAAGPPKDSMYGLATNRSGTLLAAGGNDHIVRLWDPRTSNKVAKLRGHTDCVRSLAVSPDGTQVLSGSSDGTIKLWDIGLCRCMHTYKLHADSVWCLLPSGDFKTVYSGGRDQVVFRTNLSTRSAELLLHEDRPLRALEYDVASASLWTATDRSTVKRWDTAAASSSSVFPVLERSSLRLRRRSFDAPAASSKPPSIPQHAGVIEGIPALSSARVLNDKRRVVSRNVDGGMALWDVLAGRQVKDLGTTTTSDASSADAAAALDDAAAQHFTPQAVPTWFGLDVRLGQLCITLSPPDCFYTEVYALEMGYEDAADDLKANYGKIALECALAKWRAEAERQAAGGSAEAGADGGAGEQPVPYDALLPQYWATGTPPPAVLCTTSTGVSWRLLSTQFNGTEAEPQDLPSWVGDVVLRGVHVAPKESKLAFILLPADGSDMPSLMQSKLNAPRILQVHKVANYCLSKLNEIDIYLEMYPTYINRPAYERPEEEDAAATSGKPTLELLCNGMGVPYEMSLASIKRYIWKKSDDLVFHFRRRDPLNPAPLPMIPPQ